jgi:glycosyltransferase involved in cell wall biosynthesis
LARILFLAPQPFFEVRGTPLAVLAMIRALTEAGHEVDLLVYPQGRDVRAPRLRLSRSLWLPVGRVKAGPSLAKLVLDVPFVVQAAWRILWGRYDVVHAVEEAAYLLAPVARLRGVPLIADLDSSIPDQLRESGFATRGPLLWAAQALERYALRRAAAVVTVCRSLSDGVRRRAPDARIFQIEDPPLVDAKSLPPAEAVAALRTDLGLAPGPVAFYSGNFEPYQGVELLVAASALIPELQVVFMGGEPRQIEAMRGQASRTGGHCVFAGKRPPEELAAFLALADVVVSPRSQGVNTPFKIYTYLASGRPLVATRILTHTQLLDDSLAFLVDVSAEGVAAGLRAALAAPAEARERALRGVALVEREYSEARYAEKVRAAYEATLG